MTPAEITSLILAVATLVSASGALVISFHNSNKIQDVHLEINSRMTELLAMNKTLSHAEGREEARKEEQERNPPLT